MSETKHGETNYARKIFTGSLTLSSMNLMLNLIGIASGALLARGLGPVEYGLFALLMSIHGFLIRFSQFGTAEFTTRYVGFHSKDKAYVHGIARFGMRVGIIAGLFFMIVVILSVWLAGLPTKFAFLMSILAMTIPLSSLNMSLEGIFRGLKEFGTVAIQKLAYSITLLIVIAYLFFTHISVESVIYGIFVAFTLSLIYSLSRYKKLVSIKKRQHVKKNKEMMGYGILAMVSGVLFFIFTRTNYYLLAYVFGMKEVGFYNIGNLAGEFLLYLGPITLSAVLLPILSEMQGKKSEKLAAASARLGIKYAVLLQLFLVMCVIFFGKPLIAIVYGAQYLPAYVPMILLAGSSVFLSVFLVFVSFYQSKLYIKPVLAFTISLLAALLVFNFFLIPAFGINGSALAFLLASILAMLVSFLLLKKEKVEIELGYLYKPIILFAVFTGLWYYFFPWSIQFGIVMGGLYLMSLIGCRILSREDLKLIKATILK